MIEDILVVTSGGVGRPWGVLVVCSGVGRCGWGLCWRRVLGVSGDFRV